MRQLIVYLLNLTGVNSDRFPDNLQMIVLLDFIREVYGNNAIQEVKLAFQMALAGKLDCERSHYQNFSSAYFGGIMAAYRVWASQVHDYHDRTRKEPKQIEQAPIEMPDDEFINAAYQTFKALRSYEVIPVSIFDILKKSGKIKLDREAKDRVKALVMDKIQSSLRTDEKFSAEYTAMSSEQREAFIQSSCMKCTVAKYFSNMILSENTSEP